MPDIEIYNCMRQMSDEDRDKKNTCYDLQYAATPRRKWKIGLNHAVILTQNSALTKEIVAIKD